MNEQEIKDLFANAKNTDDIVKVFNENPGLEDDILELGKQQGVDLNESRELTDFELDLVTGGLTLKQGVVTTMAALTLTGALFCVTSGTSKAYADESNANTQIEQIQQNENSSEIDQTDASQIIKSQQASNEKSDQTSKNADSQKDKLEESDVIDSGLNTTSQTNQVQKNNINTVDNTTDSQNTTSKQASNEKNSDQVSKNTDSSKYKREADIIEVKESTTKSKDSNAWDYVEDKTKSVFGILYDKFLPKVTTTMAGGDKKAGKVVSEVLKTVLGFDFGIGGEDPNQKILDLINDVSNNMDKYAAEIINTTNAGTQQIMTTIIDEAKKTDKKIEAVNAGSVVNDFVKSLDSITKTFVYDKDIITHVNGLNNQDSALVDEYLDDNYNGIKNSFNSVYTTALNKDKRTLVQDFDKISSEISGIDSNGNPVAVLNGNPINIFEVNKLVVDANNNYTFDNQSIDERQEFIQNTFKKYITDYSIIGTLVNYEINTTQEKMNKLLLERASVDNEINKEYIKHISGEVPSDDGFYKKYSKYLLDGDRDAPEEQQGAWARYGAQLQRAYTDLQTLRNSFENGMNAFIKEAAAIDYIKKNIGVYYNEKTGKAYKVNSVIDPDAYKVSVDGNLLTLDKNICTENNLSIPVENYQRNCLMDMDGNTIRKYDNVFDLVNNGWHVEAHRSYARYAQNGDLQVFDWASKQYEEWKKGFVNKVKDSNSVEKVIDISTEELSNPEISALFNHYIQQEGSEKIDGIFVGADDLKIESAGNFHKEVFDCKAFFKNTTRGRDHEKGIKVSKTFKYIDGNGGTELKKTTVSANLDFLNGFSDTKSNLKLGKLVDVTSVYKDGLQAAITNALNPNTEEGSSTTEDASQLNAS